MIVPYPAGGSVDVVARLVAQKLNESMGANFIVENRAGGAGGAVGANVVAKAAPDGYTLMLSASIHIITPFLNSKIPYDAVRDFAPVSLVAAGPLLVSTAPNVPAGSLKEFFDLVRKEPAKFTFATSSFGSAGHLAVELLKRDAGVDTLVIAYKGAGPMLNDIMGGQIQLIADPMASSLPLAASGKIKALAVTSSKRVAAAPDIPTIAESGMTGFDFSSWYGSCDLVFVDACHEYGYVLNDSKVALKLLAPGGVALWHDYGAWIGVTTGLNDLYRSDEGFMHLRHIVGTTLCFLSYS